MKLLRLKLDGFGPLRGEYHFDPAKLTLLVDQNERGKSSLLSAIVAGLYGLNDDKRSHRVVSPLDRWRPWAGGTYRVEIELECRDERFTITRDFERGTVAVWDDRGQERTHEFAEGKDYPVGKFLLGLDTDEFAKCAFLQQGELEQVVPDEEKSRRTSTLHARLENAADSRTSDTNATETIQVLERATERYTCDYHGKTVQVDTAIKWLEAKREFLDTEIRRFEHERSQLTAPLETLAGQVEGEREARERLEVLEQERRLRLLNEAREALAADDARRRDIEKHRDEATMLTPLASVPAATAARFGEALARYQEAQAHLEAIRARKAPFEEEREWIELEMEILERYKTFGGSDADRLAAHGQELRRIREDDERLRKQLETDLASLSEHGFTPDRVEDLLGKVGDLPAEEAAFLRGQPATIRAFQAEQAEVQALRSESDAIVERVAGRRRRLSVPGWVLLGLGVATVLAGAFLEIQSPLAPFLVPAGIILAVLSIALLVGSTVSGGGTLRTARASLAELDDRDSQLRVRTGGNDRKLEKLAGSLGYENASALLGDWSEMGRLTEQHAPVLRLREQVKSSEMRVARVLDDVHPLLEKTGHDPREAASIDAAVSDIRQLEQQRRSLAEWEKRSKEMAAQEATASEQVATRKTEARALVEAAGIQYADDQPLEGQLDEVRSRAAGAKRFRWLTEERIPGLERVLLEDDEREELEGRIAWAQATGEADETESGARGETEVTDAPRPIHELEQQLVKTNVEINERVKEQSDLRVAIERRETDYRNGHAETLRDRQSVERALRRALRFKRAVTLAADTIKSVAADTHRRWADFLNYRVTQLLQSVGADIEQVRFGEDLDFAVKPRSGPQMSRGKAAMQLSSGARDQLYLAVRLAVSEYLSRDGESLPMLIDDAFATSDDERVRKAMMLLLDHFSKHHQMIFVTCHRARYEALAQRDPGLYADRVLWLDVDSATPLPHQQMELAPESDDDAQPRPAQTTTAAGANPSDGR